jgi:hypothetical protein
MLVGKGQMIVRENWTRQNIIDEVFMLCYIMYEAWNYSCELDHNSGN